MIDIRRAYFDEIFGMFGCVCMSVRLHGHMSWEVNRREAYFDENLYSFIGLFIYWLYRKS